MADRGHRSVPHTADVRIEAWGPDRDGCLAEAVLGLADSVVDRSAAGPDRERVTVPLAAESDVDLLVLALDEVIYRLDTRDQVPVGAEYAAGELRLDMVDVHALPVVGPGPKAVTLHELKFGPDADGRWTCSVTIDI
ncbi:MAG: archease [Mycobacteriales bacterium]